MDAHREAAGEAATSEAILVERAREGSSAAWEAVVQAHQQPVFRYAYLLLGDPDEAADAAQEAFIRAYRALDRFDTARPLRPWLLSITARLASNRRRSFGRYLGALQRWVRSQPEAASAIEEAADRRWQAQTVWQAVRSLDQKDQQVIYLRYFLELSTDEVAQAAGLPAGTVKSRLSRALARLREAVQRDFPGLEEGWMG